MAADAELIRRTREAAGLTQAQLGQPLLTRQAIQSIEVGRVKPSRRSLAHIANRLDLPVEALLREVGPSAEGDLLRLPRLIEAGRYAQAVQLAAELLRLPGPTPTLLAGAHHYIGIGLYHMNDFTDAIENLRVARTHAADVPDPRMAAESMDWEAAALHLLDESIALDVSREALDQYRRIDPRQPDVEARMLQRVATILSRRGAYDEAERYYDQALQVGGVVAAMESAGPLYHGLAGISRQAGDHRRTIELMRKAIACYLFKLDGFEVRLAMAENDLALALIEVGGLGEADGLLMSTLARLSRAGGEIGKLRPYVLHSLSVLRQRQGRLREALDYAEQAIDLAAALDRPRPHAEGLVQLGNLQEVNGHPRLADRSYRSAIEVLRAAGETNLEQQTVKAYRDLRRNRKRSQPMAAS